MNTASRTVTYRNPVLNHATASCELNTVLDDVLTKYAERLENKFVSPITECALIVRLSAPVLERAIGLIIEGMLSAGLWGDGEQDCISPLLCKCLSGYGAVLELTDESMALTPRLMSQLAQKDSLASQDLPGWQLIKARDLIEHHGGRLYVESPLWHGRTGTSIRLCLPLSANAIHPKIQSA